MKILSKPKGNAEEYGRWSVNPYLGCSHQCAYCYLQSGPGAKTLGGDVPHLKTGVVNEEHAYHLAMAEIIENREAIIRDGGLFFTFTSDPCMPETCDLTYKIASDSMDLGIPVTLLTKDADFCGKDSHAVQFITTAFQVNSWLIHIEMFKSTYQERMALGFTLTGHDELEPNASPNAERIKAMEYLTNDGWKTWASIEPVIDFDASFEMIQQALDAGCEHFKIGLMTRNTKVCRSGFKFGEHDFRAYGIDECCQFVNHVMALTEGRATVYWKQSFVEFLEQRGQSRTRSGSAESRQKSSEAQFLQGPKKEDPQPVHGMTAREFLSQWPHSVGKDWTMFNL